MVLRTEVASVLEGLTHLCLRVLPEIVVRSLLLLIIIIEIRMTLQNIRLGIVGNKTNFSASILFVNMLLHLNLMLLVANLAITK